MMNTIFALSMVAGVGLTTGTPIIGARVAEEMWAAGRADGAQARGVASENMLFRKCTRVSTGILLYRRKKWLIIFRRFLRAHAWFIIYFLNAQNMVSG